MSTWDFNHESTANAAGANVQSQLTVGNQPFFEADSLASKRNVILTEKGWVRRQSYTDAHSTVRTKDEVLVAAHPGTNDGFSYLSNTHGGNPDVAQIYLPATAANNVQSNVYVIFNTPISWQASANNLKLHIANTTLLTANIIATSNGTLAAISNSSFNSKETHGNNAIVFNFTPANTGVYTIPAQTIQISNSTYGYGDQANGNPLYNPDVGVTAAANLVISGPVSNALGEFTVTA